MSEAQDEARRMNARKSTGPRTEEGKNVARFNAVKHGLRSQFFEGEVAVDDDDAGYKDILDELMEHYQPKNPVEELLVKRIALLDWRLHRISLAEIKSMHASPGTVYSLPPAGAMERILKYERTMDRELHRAISTLQRLRRGDTQTRARSEEIDRDLQDEQDGGA